MKIALQFLATLCVLVVPSIADDKADELNRLNGVWRVVATGGHGQVVKAEGDAGDGRLPLWEETRFTIQGGVLNTKLEPTVLPQPAQGIAFVIRQEPAQYTLKPAKAEGDGPKPIDLVIGRDVVLKGIYELKGDELKLCVVSWMACHNEDPQRMAQAADKIVRPTAFTTQPGGEHVSFVLKRVK